MTLFRGALAGLFCCFAVGIAQAQAGLEHIFDAPEGTLLKGVTLAADKSVYAVLSAGGPHNQGMLIRHMPDGQVFVLHAFSAADSGGSKPNTAPAFGSDGAVYGTTSQGGKNGFGSLYRLDDCDELQTLHDFTSDDGGPVVGPLWPAADGGFYAVTYGLYDENPLREQYGEWAWITRVPGKIIYVSNTGSTRVLAQTLTQPNGGVILASDGYLYGTEPRIVAYRGPPVTWGNVYRVRPDGSDYGSTAGFQPLDFNPGGQVTQGPDGYIYGVSAGGREEGARSFRFGTDFIDRLGDEYREVAREGSTAAGLAFGSDGNAYGASGTFYRATPSGIVTHIHEIDAATPPPTAAIETHPDGGFVVPSGDHLLRLSQAGGIAVLHRFGYQNGAELSELWQARDGRVYGTTNSGGENSAGTLFRFESDGTLHTLVSWPGWTRSAWSPPRRGALSEALDGTLYGISDRDGYSLFSVSTSGEFKTLHVFDTTDAPYRYYAVGAQVVAGRDGALYGTLSSEEADLEGVYAHNNQVFRLRPDGSALSFLAHSEQSRFNYLLSARDGALYAIAATEDPNNRRYALVRITSDGALTTLHEFRSDGEGHDPDGNLVEAADGSIYGYARARSTATQNVIYRWASGQGLSIKYTLSGTETYAPKLVIAPDGTLVGTGTDPYSARGVFIVKPSGRLIKQSDPGLGTLVGNDSTVYRIEPISRDGYSGFRLTPIEAPN